MSAAFTSAWCSRSKLNVESCPHDDACMSAVLPYLHTKKPQAKDKRKTTRRSINNMTQADSCIKGALLGCCIHVSLALKEQADDGIMPIARCLHERSFAVPSHKKPQARDKRKSTRRSINNMTQADSCIKGRVTCPLHSRQPGAQGAN